MDRVLKDYYDSVRAREDITLPAELAADGRLDKFKLYHHAAQLKRWRFWKTGLQAQVAPGVFISGAIDDLLAPIEQDGPYAMIDYKTRGAPPKPGDTEKYYGIQANCYSLMLDANGMKTAGKGYFAYYWPAKGGVKGGHMPDQMGPIVDFAFEHELVEIDTNPAAAAELAFAAAQCLDGLLPDPTATCEQCGYLQAHKVVMARFEATLSAKAKTLV